MWLVRGASVFLWFICNWKQKQKRGKLAVTDQVLTIWVQLLQRCGLTSLAGCFRSCRSWLSFFIWVWSLPLCQFSLSLAVPVSDLLLLFFFFEEGSSCNASSPVQLAEMGWLVAGSVGHPSRYIEVYHHGFSLHFATDYNEHLFMSFFEPCISFLGKYLLPIFVCVLLLIVLKVFYILWI